jgi:ABC-type multidrug transport system fused ATPase/permease subunit
MVAHRLTTIQQVSKILVLEAGVVTEFGTPQELLNRPSYYSRVASGQVRLDQHGPAVGSPLAPAETPKA